MFLRAGFNRRFKAICVCRSGSGPAYLVRFERGDLAWLYGGKVRWSAPYIADLIEGPAVWVGLGQCRLNERPGAIRQR